MSHIGVMWKTVSEDCNLACDYCYYSTCGGTPGNQIRKIVFEEVVALQAKYAPPNIVISNALQTNGTLIHERWAAFFKRYHFLIGVSIAASSSHKAARPA